MVTQIVKEQSTYDAAFRALQSDSAAATTTTTAWLGRLRESAFDRFEQLGFPTTDEEEWKYTNVAPIAKRKFALPSLEPQAGGLPLDAAQLEPFLYEEARQSRLVFVNGIYRAELSSQDALPEGLIAASLYDALHGDFAEILREQLARSADYNKNAFTVLNTAFINGGAFVFIPKGVRVESPIHLLFLSTGQTAEEPTASFPRVLVVAAEGSEATIIESHASVEEDAVYWTNAVVEIVLADNARLEHYKLQRESQQAFHTATTVAELGRSSSFNSTTITMGSALARHDINIILDHEGAECWVDGLYVVGHGQHADTHSVIDHRKAHCTSHQLYKGILDGKSRAVFNGKVFVREGAQKTDAMQTNRNLLLSDEARVDTKPQLEIFADDVKCAHGATVGQLEEEELFYLISRGLRPELARNLLTYGFAEEVINKISVESIRAQLDEAVLNRLHASL